jgi:hypothetical protein
MSNTKEKEGNNSIDKTQTNRCKYTNMTEHRRHLPIIKVAAALLSYIQ